MRGLATAGLKDTDSAVDEIQKALELDPSRATTYANLGALQLARGRSDEAEAALKQAVMLAPTESAPKLALANFYWLSNRRDQAEATLKEALTRQAERSGSQPHPLLSSTLSPADPRRRRPR